MRQKNIILAARLLSMMFTPFYLSTVGLIVLFTFSYLSLAPWQYKLRVIGMVYLFSLNRRRSDADVLLPPSSGRSLTCFGRVMLHGLPLPQ